MLRERLHNILTLANISRVNCAKFAEDTCSSDSQRDFRKICSERFQLRRMLPKRTRGFHITESSVQGIN